MAESDADGVAAITTIMGALKPLDEATRTNVIQFILKQLRIEMTEETPSAAFRGPANAEYDKAFPQAAPQAGMPDTDIRSLAEQKKPKTVSDKVAVLAYYLKSLAPADERRDFVTSEDITTYFPQADWELPVARMALANAKNAGYLIALGGGQYRLNPVGHNLVTHKLGDRDGGEVTQRRRKRKKVGKKKRR